MADAARPAHPGGFPLVAVFSLGLVMMPLRVHAGAAAPGGEAVPVGPVEAGEPGAVPEGGAPDEGRAEGDAGVGPGGEGDASGEGPGEDAGGDATAEAEAGGEAAEGEVVAEAEPGDEGDDGDDGDEAAADEESTDDAKTTDPGKTAPGALGPTAAPLRPMQTAAWWTMFGAFAVGTTAGVLAGLAERQEDRATRLSTLFDSETGAQPRYVDRMDEYEQYLRRGEGFAKAALGVGIVAGAATIAAITLFAIDAGRQRGERAPSEKRRASLRVRGGGVEVRF